MIEIKIYLNRLICEGKITAFQAENVVNIFKLELNSASESSAWLLAEKQIEKFLDQNFQKTILTSPQDSI
tara:strand:- start:117 stop:326 length:210 start_codon:yes stop_codon:yes gene_type:complete